MTSEASGDLSDGRVGLIHYDSANPFEFFHILQGEAGDPQPMFGWLILPDTPAREPMPCVVCCHGSLSWRGHHHEYMVRFLEAGMAVFRVHSFDARNVQSVVADQMAVTMAMMLSDCYRALALLQTHPRIDGERIGITGWSLGGGVALYAAWEPLRERLIDGDVRFAAHLPVYPAAHIRGEDNRWTSAPVRVLHGADDDYTPLRFVEDLISEIKPLGVDIDVISYPGGHHSFDSIEPLTWLPDAIRLGRSTTKIDTDGQMYVEGSDGSRYAANTREDRAAGFRATRNVGAHIGGNWAARRRCFDDATAFFAAHLL